MTKLRLRLLYFAALTTLIAASSSAPVSDSADDSMVRSVRVPAPSDFADDSVVASVYVPASSDFADDYVVPSIHVPDPSNFADDSMVPSVYAPEPSDFADDSGVLPSVCIPASSAFADGYVAPSVSLSKPSGKCRPWCFMKGCKSSGCSGCKSCSTTLLPITPAITSTPPLNYRPLVQCMREILSTWNSTLRVLSPDDSTVFLCSTEINNLYAREMFAPGAVAMPKTVEEVQHAVKVSQMCSAPAFTIVSGGHNAAGYNLNTGGVVLNLQDMQFLKVDKENLVMTAQAGVRWEAVYPQLNNTGIGVTGGGCSHVGVAGFTLGGGWSWISRSYGLASDNLLDATVVLSNGTIISVNKDTAARNSEVSDLWFALRGGGGGNFGVVVELQMKLHATRQVKSNGTSVTGTGLAGEMCWSLTRSKENATKAMQKYGEWMDKLPDEMTGAVIMTSWTLPTIEYRISS